ncbi:MAG: F0F1 ATP synthase subunit epsilon [Neisseriales bacterium]|nr:MAG: F0F1 ATP synthase subunit epsilon [Neisseriales bacterium]
MKVMQVEIVSSERSIYSGQAVFVTAPGVEGEIGIYPQHTPLLTRIKPGLLRLVPPGDKQEVLIAISGGLLEIQPTLVTVLADTALRDDELDEQRAIKAKETAEQILKKTKNDKAITAAHASLAAAIAELKALYYLRHRKP